MSIEEKIEHNAQEIEMLKRQVEQLKPKQYLTRKEAARMFKVSLTTIDLAVKSGELESEMIRGNRRIIIRP